MTEGSPSLLTEQTEIFVIAGFLGSGKTTLLKRILAWDADLRNTAVIVNEFGKVGLDSDMLKQGGSDVIELTSGCVCCTMKADLNLTLQALWKRSRPTRILIELSGVGNPVSVVETLNEAAMHDHMAVKKVITIVDADNWEVRDCFGSLFSKQIQEADLILLNKSDTVDPKQILFFLKEINELVPDAEVIPTIYSNVDFQTLFAGSAWNLPRPINALKSTADIETDLDRADRLFVTFSFQGPEILNETCFHDFMRNLPWELFRVKGTVRFENRTVFVNHVGNKTEWENWLGRDETRLVFIGCGIDSEATTRNLKRCVLQSRDNA